MKIIASITIILSITAIILLSGCISTGAGNGLALSLYADPSTVFGQGMTRLYIDVDNRDVKTLENIEVTAFDTGILDYVETRDWGSGYKDLICQKFYESLKPNQFDTFSCSLAAPKIELPSLQTDVHVKAAFDTEFSAVQLAEMITVDEYDRRIASKKFASKPSSYSYRDKYIELQIEFSEELPIVVREKEYFIYFTVKNIGNGFIGPIYPEDFFFEQKGNSLIPLIKCNRDMYGSTYLLDMPVEPIGKSFPRLACEIEMPSDLQFMANYELTIHLRYSYEIRDKITVNIVR